MLKQVFGYNKKILTLLIIMLIAQISVIIYFGSLKEGYHMDEICSYELSNSFYKPFPFDTEKWLGNNYFDDYLTVGNNPGFRYDSVYYNQMADVHPPLFYFLLHTICSFTPNVFSKWTGISLNLAFFIGIIFILFLCSRKILKNDYLSLIVCFIWGFSIGAISSVVFIRMYVMLTFFIVLSVYLYMRALDQNLSEKQRNKTYLLIGITTFLGFWTQYYFIVFTFFIAGLYFIYLALEKDYKNLKKFSRYTISSVLLAVFLFPASIFHIFIGYKGAESFSHIGSLNNYIDELMGYFKILNQSIFAGWLLWIIVLLTSILAIKLIIKKNLKLSFSHLMFAFIFIPSTLYFFVITKSAPEISIRYMLCIFPLVTLCFVYLMDLMFNFLKTSLIKIFLIYLICLIIIAKGFISQKVDFLYIGESKKVKTAQQYSNNKCLILAKADWRVTGSIPTLRYYSDAYTHVTDPSNLSYIQDKKINDCNELIVYIDSSFNQDDLIKYISELTNLKDNQFLFESGYFKAYHLT